MTTKVTGASMATYPDGHGRPLAVRSGKRSTTQSTTQSTAATPDVAGRPETVDTIAVTPVFSIGLTTYDRIDLLKQSVTSILNQTFAGFELVICNDNPARSLTLDDLEVQDPRIRIVNHATNLGQVGSWKSLLDNATGRYFTWIADDDLYAADFLEASHAALAAHGFPPCVYSAFEIFSGPDPLALTPAFSSHSTLESGLDLLGKYLRDEVKLLGNMGIFDRRFLVENTPWQEMRCPGIALFREYIFVLLAARLPKVAYIPDPLIYYRDHPGSWGSSNAQINEYYSAGRWLVRQSSSMLERAGAPELQEQLVMMVFNLVLKQLVSKRKNAYFAIDVDVLYSGFVGPAQVDGGIDGANGNATARSEWRRSFLALCRQYVEAETSRIEKESVIRTQHDALEKIQSENHALAQGLESKESVIQGQHQALKAAETDRRLNAKSIEEKESLVAALRNAVEGAEDNSRLLTRGLEEKEAIIQAQSAALRKAEGEARQLVRGLEEKEALIQALHRAVESAENSHRVLAKNLEEKEAVVQTLHKALERNDINHRLLATGLEEKEAMIHAQNASLQRVESEFRQLGRVLEEKEGVVQALHKAVASTEHNLRLLAQRMEEKEAVVHSLRNAVDEATGKLQTAETNHRLVAAVLAEKESIIQGLQRSIEGAESNHRLLAGSIEQYAARVRQQEEALDKAQAQHAAFVRNVEEAQANVLEQKEAVIQDLRKVQGEHQLLTGNLAEKEAIIQDLSKAVSAYRSAFSVVGFIIRPANRLAARSHAARQRLQQILTPRLGRLNQYPPQPMRLPTSYARPTKISQPPKISIVTPSFKQARFIERTIRSVLDQDYPNLEYYVKDAASNDGTLEILQRYANKLAGWESTPDRGQSEAINIAFARTSGEIMAWLNSDDIILPGALAYVASFFQKHPDIDVVYGHRILIDESDQQIGRWLMPAHHDEVLSWADYVPQETLFWRRRIWEKAGGRIDESFRFAMDWDLLVRFREAGAKFRRLPRFLGAFRIHEHQKTSAVINEIGILEMNRIRERLLGRVPSHEEVGRSVQSYLKKHLALDLFYRVKARLPGNRYTPPSVRIAGPVPQTIQPE